MKGKSILIAVCIADAALLAACAFLYTRQDRTVPVISFNKEDGLLYEDGMDAALLLEGVSAYDEQDGDVSDSILIEKISRTADGNVIVTYAAMDASKNVGKASRILAAGREEAPDKAPGAAEDDSGIESEEPEPVREDGQLPGDEDSQDQDGQDREGPGEENGQDHDDQEQDGQDREGQEAENRQDVQGRPEQGQADSRQQRTDNVNNSREARQQSGNGNGQDTGPAQGDQDGAGGEAENRVPVLRLNSDTLTVSAGTQAVDWNQCIGELSDDKDSRLQLFANLSMDGLVDLDTPGVYPVTIYTRDSDGAESERQAVNVKVE